MFEQLTVVAREVHAEMLGLYWMLLTPLVLLLIVFEMFKGQKETIDVFDILRRVIISVVLLISFNQTINLIAMLGDGMVNKIDKIVDVWDVLKNLGPNYKDSSSNFFVNRRYCTHYFSKLA